MPLPPVLVLACGNPSRGDDALGPLLARRVQAWLDGSDREKQVEIIEDYQLQIEHALDIAQRRLVLFVDAGTGTRPPFDFCEARPQRRQTHTTHALAPQALLGVYEAVHGAAPPPAFILCLEGVGFELGNALSAPAKVHLERGFEFCQSLLEQPTANAWRRLANAERTEMAGHA